MPRLFGTDGVRGTVGEFPMIPEFALALGRAAGFIFSVNDKRATVIVGRDTRQSGPMLNSALIAGLVASSVDVMDVGVIPTPAVAWLVRRLNAAAGAVISASHNPVSQNGIKFFGASGFKLSEKVEEEIERLADPQPHDEPLDWRESDRRPGRIVDGRGMHELYIESLLSEHHDLRLDHLRVVLDCANGAASEYAPDLFSRLGAQVIAIHASPTGVNINVDAGSEHARQNPQRMATLIQEHHAHFGITFDGDADRVIFVDDKGGVVDGDHILGMLGRYLDLHKKLLARSVVTTTMRNAGFKTYVESFGLTLYETPVGDKYVADKLLELCQPSAQNGVYGLGGEQSGHIMLMDDEHATGDGMRTALFVMRAFVESKVKTMSEFAAGVGKTPQVIASADVGRGARMEKAALADLEKKILAHTKGLARINLRYSGTEPKFRAMLESDGAQDEYALAKLATKICRDVQVFAEMKDGEIEIQNCTRGGLLTMDV
ncbi:MAG: phosphoglucosamine mutase [Chloroflexota bacterium]